MCPTSPETCYRSGVLQQLNTWAQYPHHAQLLFVEQLALECLSDWIWQARFQIVATIHSRQLVKTPRDTYQHGLLSVST